MCFVGWMRFTKSGGGRNDRRTYVGALLELIDAMNREKFTVVFRPVEMSDGWEWVEAQEVRDGA